MRSGGWMMALAGGGLSLFAMSGCISLDEHLKLKQAHRLVEAEKEQVGTDLYDERQVNDTLRTKLDSLESEKASREALIANLKQENDRLDQIMKQTMGLAEGMAGKTHLPDITIASALPPQLDSALKKFADAYPSQVVYDPASGSVKWSADLLFDLGSDEVKTSSLDALKGFTDILRSPAAADFEAVIAGHTDNVRIAKPGTKEKHPTNWHLSAHRAIAVSELLTKNGYAGDRVSVMGCSEYRPIADNASEAGKKQNRRVEIYLVPRGTIVQGSKKVASSAPTSKTATPNIPPLGQP